MSDLEPLGHYVRGGGVGYQPTRFVRVTFGREFVLCSPLFVHLLMLERVQRDAERLHGPGVELELVHVDDRPEGWRCTFRVTVGR